MDRGMDSLGIYGNIEERDIVKESERQKKGNRRE